MMIRKVEKSKKVNEEGEEEEKTSQGGRSTLKNEDDVIDEITMLFSSLNQDSKTLSKVSSTWPEKHCLARPLSARY